MQFLKNDGVSLTYEDTSSGTDSSRSNRDDAGTIYCDLLPLA